jgi:hypothetical protein
VSQRTPSNSSRSNSSAGNSNTTSETPASDAAKKAVQDDVDSVRAKQCSEAQERYKKYIESRRLYKPGKDGERTYLTDQEIDAERLNAKREVDATCNSST